MPLHSDNARPMIGITVTHKDGSAASGVYQLGMAYGEAVAAGGGLPVMLAQDPALAGSYASRLAGVIFTGGLDPRTECFGHPMHPNCRPVDAGRQAFELALLKAMDGHPDKPVLGICLGMQMMALHRGGRLHQYLPERLLVPQVHRQGYHTLCLSTPQSVLVNSGNPLPQREAVRSNHQQAVADPGRLRVVARASDGVIEAVDDPARPFYLGVQWHPEAGGKGELSWGLIARFVAACRTATSLPTAPRRPAAVPRPRS